MHELLRCFFELNFNTTEQEIRELWTSPDTFFVFDTNVFLELYSFDENTREDFFKILEILKGRVFMPFHIALEFENRRLAVIARNIEKFLSPLQAIKNFQTKLNEELAKLALLNVLKNDQESLDKAISSIEETINLIKKQQVQVKGVDNIRDRIYKAFENSIGNPLFNSQEELLHFGLDADKRYKLQIPPGFNDVNKEKESNPFLHHGELVYERKYGDLIIFSQIIERFKNDETIKTLIFITNDTKSDFWNKIKCEGDKLIGPRPSLRQELFSKTRIENFLMKTQQKFIEEAVHYPGLNLNPESANKARDVIQFDLIKSSSDGLDNDMQLESSYLQIKNLDALKNLLLMSGIDLERVLLNFPGLFILISEIRWKYDYLEIKNNNEILNNINSRIDDFIETKYWDFYNHIRPYVINAIAFNSIDLKAVLKEFILLKITTKNTF